MEVLQTRILHHNIWVIITLLTFIDCSKSNQEQKIQQHINKTVFVGETVTLHCNKTSYDDDFTWKMNNSVIFRQVPDFNITNTNFSSDRIYINPAAPRELKIHQIQASDAGNYSCFPAAIRWILTITDCSKSNQEQKIQQHINKTVFVGETVTLHCNKTSYDDDFTWKMNNSVIFRQVPDINITNTNFSSNRIYINPSAPRELKIHQIQASDAGNYSCFPAAIRWILTITENRPASPREMPLYIIIIIVSCSGVIMVCLIITISICIHRKQMLNMKYGLSETVQENVSIFTTPQAIQHIQ
ncbi:uncharacterized protein [Pseudorasbora parva]|uniref:uncharacterized protein n=1 Tax=Pseudorasbora parva TaxID=51549 RepID=UPI00351F03D7